MPRKQKKPTPRKACPDCNTTIGKYHVLGCDVETCPCCGRQLLLCLETGCRAVPADSHLWPPPLDDRLAWSGFLPGEAECHKLGWFMKQVKTGQWLSCKPGEAGAVPDLERVVRARRITCLTG
jgi:hypothetical protein